MILCKDILKKRFLEMLVVLVTGCLIFPSFSLAEDRIKGKYEVIG